MNSRRHVISQPRLVAKFDLSPWRSVQARVTRITSARSISRDRTSSPRRTQSSCCGGPRTTRLFLQTKPHKMSRKAKQTRFRERRKSLIARASGSRPHLISPRLCLAIGTSMCTTLSMKSSSTRSCSNPRTTACEEHFAFSSSRILQRSIRQRAEVRGESKLPHRRRIVGDCWHESFTVARQASCGLEVQKQPEQPKMTVSISARSVESC